eukprot:7904874-Pyramimonas_sp.AAC.1
MPSSAAVGPAARASPPAWAYLAQERTPSASCACVRTATHGACWPRTSRRCSETHPARQGISLTAGVGRRGHPPRASGVRA